MPICTVHLFSIIAHRQSGELTQHDPSSLTEPLVLSFHVCGIWASVRPRTGTRWQTASEVAASSEPSMRWYPSLLACQLSRLRLGSSLGSLSDLPVTPAWPLFYFIQSILQQIPPTWGSGLKYSLILKSVVSLSSRLWQALRILGSLFRNKRHY